MLDEIEVRFASCRNAFGCLPFHPSSRGTDRSKCVGCVLLGAAICTEEHTAVRNILSRGRSIDQRAARCRIYLAALLEHLGRTFLLCRVRRILPRREATRLGLR